LAGVYVIGDKQDHFKEKGKVQKTPLNIQKQEILSYNKVIVLSLVKFTDIMAYFTVFLSNLALI
jgi:hypothetical protein